jgi:hypothetical protein
MQGKLTLLSEAGKEELEYRIRQRRRGYAGKILAGDMSPSRKECHLRIRFGTKTGMKKFIIPREKET